MIIKVIVKEGDDLVPFNIFTTLDINTLKSIILGDILESFLKQNINLTIIKMINCVVFDKHKDIIDGCKTNN